MAMLMAGGSRRARAEMNVTPLIDVLLVLLIIFMVITPITSQGVPAQVPQLAPDRLAQADVDEPPVVLMVAADGAIRINQDLTRREDLTERLRKIFQYRSARVLFVDAAPDTEFEVVARVLDEAKAIVSVGLMPNRR